MSIIWHNGIFKEDGPVFTANDRLRLGECVFDTILAVDAKPIRSREHFKKLLHAASIFWNEQSTLTFDVFENILAEILNKNNFKQGRYAINTIITGGPGGNGLKKTEKQDLQTIIRAFRVPEIFPDIHAIIAQSTRRNEGSPLSKIKCSAYGDHILALREAEDKGANEAILLNNAGHITCTTTANIIVFDGKKLLTPPVSDGVQAGLTREILIKKFGVTEKTIKPEDLKTAAGIYLCNNLRGLQPLKTLDGKEIHAPSLEIPKDFHLI